MGKTRTHIMSFAWKFIFHFILRIYYFWRAGWEITRRTLIRRKTPLIHRQQYQEQESDTSCSFDDNIEQDDMGVDIDNRIIPFLNGLVNTGNTCFVNAVVQCLCATPLFLEQLEKNIQAFGENTPEQFILQLDVAKAFLALCKHLNRVGLSRDRQQNEISNQSRLIGDRTRHLQRHLLEALSKTTDLVASAPSIQRQEDAEEFLSFLLEMLHEIFKVEEIDPFEYNRSFQRRKLCMQELKQCRSEEPSTYVKIIGELAEIDWNDFQRRNKSMITDLFVGQTVHGSRCIHCGQLSCLHQQTRVLSLPVDTLKETIITLRDCLDKLQSTERLVDENSVQCEGSCKKKTSRVTQVLFQRLPHILVIQLQRFKQSTSWFSPAIVYEKLDRKIELNNPLNLTANMFVRDKSDPVLYQLFAVCAHTGRSIDSGHYLAYIRRMENGSWIRFDDDYVEEISNAEMEEETLSTAYLLFYMRSMPS